MSRLLPLAALLLLAGGCALVPLYAEPLPPQAEPLTAVTEDGWKIALVRYRPQGTPKGLPVLLCHGISANGRNMDLDAEHSLARWFASQGRDSFTVTLRGGGDSDHAAPEQGREASYTIDTYVLQDLPAAIAKVREATGAPKVDFVGHSMGGLIGYMYLARGGDGINAAVTLGSPARFAWGGKVEQLLGEAGENVGSKVDNLDVPTLAHTVMPFHGYFRGAPELLLYNPDNLSADTWRRFIAVGLATVSGGVLRQFALWMREDAMLSADGLVDYGRLLAGVRTPVMVVGGKADRTAPGPAVRAGYDWLGGPKRYFIAGRENGFAYDYGHVDLLLGERAGEELWPRLRDFLDANQPCK